MNQSVNFEEFQASISKINKNLEPRRRQLSIYDFLMILYLLGALLLTVTLGVVFAVHVHFALSIVIGVAYFVGLRFVIVKLKKKQNEEILKIHFNLAIMLKNENERFFSKYRIKARPGYLSKWIEFHWDNPYGSLRP